MHLQVCGGEEKERNIRTCSLALPPQAGPGGAGWGVVWHGDVRRWAWVHDMLMNGPSKSDPKPRRPAACFYRLFLL
jgi:hypothetical protein